MECSTPKTIDIHRMLFSLYKNVGISYQNKYESLLTKSKRKGIPGSHFGAVHAYESQLRTPSALLEEPLL